MFVIVCKPCGRSAGPFDVKICVRIWGQFTNNVCQIFFIFVPWSMAASNPNNLADSGYILGTPSFLTLNADIIRTRSLKAITRSCHLWSLYDSIHDAPLHLWLWLHNFPLLWTLSTFSMRAMPCHESTG